MVILKIFLIVVEVLCSLLLIAVILLQKSKGEGLGMAFGAEMGEALFGARAGNVLTRVTIWLGVIFLLNTTILAKIYTRNQFRSLIDTRPPAPVEQRTVPVQPGMADIEGLSPYPEPGAPVESVAPAEPAAPVETSVPKSEQPDS